MELTRTTVAQLFKIKKRKYSTQEVLLAAHRIGTHNEIVFTEDPSMGTKPYYISGRDAHQCKVGSNGKINVYYVPVRFLEPLERVDNMSKKQMEFKV